MLSLEDKIEIIRLKWSGRLFHKDDNSDPDVDEGNESPEKTETGYGHGNTKLPYGIAKGLGIDTTGMTPYEVWDILTGKGYSSNLAYAALKSGKKGGEVGNAAKVKSESKSPFPGFKSVGDRKYHVGKKDWDEEYLDKVPEGTTITIPGYQIPGGPKIGDKKIQLYDGMWHYLDTGDSFSTQSGHAKHGFFGKTVTDSLQFGKGYLEVQYPEDGYVSPLKKKLATEEKKTNEEAIQKKADVLKKIQKKGWKETSKDTYSISPKEAGGSILESMPGGTTINIPGMGTVEKSPFGTWKMSVGKKTQSFSSSTLSTKIKKNGQQLELKLPDLSPGGSKKEQPKKVLYKV